MTSRLFDFATPLDPASFAGPGEPTPKSSKKKTVKAV
jgi:hypothetical protein